MSSMNESLILTSFLNSFIEFLKNLIFSKYLIETPYLSPDAQALTPISIIVYNIKTLKCQYGFFGIFKRKMLSLSV